MRLLKKSLFWGVAGAVALLLATAIRIVQELPRVLQAEGAGWALAKEILPVLAIGFTCGFLSRLLARVLGRHGILGKAVIGAIMVPFYLFSFLFAAGEEALAEYGHPAFLILGAVIGMIGVPLGFQGLGEMDDQI